LYLKEDVPARLVELDASPPSWPREMTPDRLLAHILDGVPPGPGLVLLPGHLPLLAARVAGGAAPAWDRTPGFDVTAVCRVATALEAAARDLAGRRGLYLCLGLLAPPTAGRRPSPEACVIGPGGEVLLRQRPIHLHGWEAGLGLEPGDDLAVCDTDVGRLGVAAGADAWSPEVHRILALQGATVVLVPQAMLRPYTRELQLAGLWQQVQQNQVFGLEACMTGEPAGLRLAGRTAALAPLEITPGETGFLAALNDAAQGPVHCLTVGLSHRELTSVWRAYPIFNHLNETAYDRWLGPLYRGPVPAGPEGRG